MLGYLNQTLYDYNSSKKMEIIFCMNIYVELWTTKGNTVLVRDHGHELNYTICSLWGWLESYNTNCSIVILENNIVSISHIYLLPRTLIPSWAPVLPPEVHVWTV